MYETNANNSLDETLVSRAQGGDKQSIDDLLLKYSRLVRYCARKFFLVGGETEDLIQEGMMGLFSAILDYKGKADGGMNFKNFAYLCVWRRIVDAVKTAASKKNAPLNNGISANGLELISYAPDPEEEMILNDDKQELKKVMSRVLSDYEFKVFNMYMDGMTSAEICETIEKSGKSVDNAVQRSRKKLQEALKK